MTSTTQTCSISCDSYISNMTTRIYENLVRGTLTDCVIVAEGKFVRAHKLILSISSEYFESVFNAIGIEKPLIVMPPNIRFIDLCSILDFVYLGHANVPQNRLDDFLKAGELFQIRGIKEGRLHFLTSQGRQQFQANSAQINNLKSIVVTPLTSSSGSSSTSSFDPTITSTQDPSGILRPPSKRIREDDEQEDISIQEASEIMKMLLDHPELDDHPIKAEQLKETGAVAVQQMQNQTQQHELTQQCTTGATCPAQPANNVKPKFLCRFCGRGLSTKGRVQKHEKECNDNPHREIAFCEVCFIELKPSSLNHHMNSKHGIKNGIKTPRHQPASYGPTDMSPNDHNGQQVLKTTPTSMTSSTSTTTSPPQQSPDGNHVEKSPDHPLTIDVKVEKMPEPVLIEIVNEEPQINVD